MNLENGSEESKMPNGEASGTGGRIISLQVENLPKAPPLKGQMELLAVEEDLPQTTQGTRSNQQSRMKQDSESTDADH